jgi:hypothetical protein
MLGMIVCFACFLVHVLIVIYREVLILNSSFKFFKKKEGNGRFSLWDDWPFT